MENAFVGWYTLGFSQSHRDSHNVLGMLVPPMTRIGPCLDMLKFKLSRHLRPR